MYPRIMSSSSGAKGPLSELIDRVIALCPLPASAQRILQLTSDPNVDIKEVGRVLATDPALAAELMRLANSAAYSRGVAATDLVQAILKLGIDELRQMAGAMAILAAFPTEEAFTTSLRTASVLAGAIARDLAQKTRAANVGTAYVCGLLSEVGAMACAAIDGKNYIALRAACGDDGSLLAEGERARYGFTSAEIGSALLARNNLPRELSESVLGSLDASSTSLAPLARVTVFARHAAPLVIDAATNAQPASLSESLATLAKRVGLDSIEPEELSAICLHAAKSTVSALSGAAPR
jgi:HD-like signal output (HDOD) protein